MKIGSIWTCIGGDMRYSTKLTVSVDEHNEISITVSVGSPAGGMDSFTDSIYRDQVLWKGDFNAVSAKELVKEIKACLKKNICSTIVRYGKPTKNFEWNIEHEIVTGLNVKLAKAALAWANEI